MDDGDASAFQVILFLLLLFIEAVLTGFHKAIHLMNEKEIERKAKEEKDKKSILLNRIVVRATIYINSIQMIITLINLIMGCFFLPRWTVSFAGWLSGISFMNGFGDSLIRWIALIMATFCLMYIY